LQISTDFFIYAVSTANFTQVIELCHIALALPVNKQDQLKDQVAFLVQNYILNRKKFDKVLVAFLNQDFNLVPQSFTLEDNVKPLLKFTTGLKDIKTAISHEIKGLKFCYTIEPGLLNYIEKTFVNASVRHTGAVNIHLLFSQHSLSDKDTLICIHDGFIELLLKNNDAVQFYNVFHYQNDEDVLYYLLFTMEQFNINPLFVKIAIAGQRKVTDPLLKNLKKYIKHISFCVHDREVSLQGELEKLPKHYYFTLLNQHTCEL